MKKILQLLAIISFVLIFTACSGPEPVEEYCCYYNVELKITNESTIEKKIEISNYCLSMYFDDINYACKYYKPYEDYISPKTNKLFSSIVLQEFTTNAFLSHIITIDGKNFAGFDVGGLC